MNKCVQCGQPADLLIRWLAKLSNDEHHPQSCHICNGCMAMVWSKYHNTQFGQTVIIEES